MKRRVLAMFLAFSIGMLMLAGCKKNEGTKSAEESGTNSTTVANTKEEKTTASDKKSDDSTEKIEKKSRDGVERNMISEENNPYNAANVVDISINPQIRLYLDEDDKIIAFDYINDDAEIYYCDLDLIDSSFEEVVELIYEISAENKLGMSGEIMEVELSQVHFSEQSEDLNESIEIFNDAIEILENEQHSGISGVFVSTTSTFVTEYDENYHSLKEIVSSENYYAEKEYYQNGRLRRSCERFEGALLDFIRTYYINDDGSTSLEVEYSNGLLYRERADTRGVVTELSLNVVPSSDFEKMLADGTAKKYEWGTGCSFNVYEDATQQKPLVSYYYPGDMIVVPVYADNGERLGTVTYSYTGKILLSDVEGMGDEDTGSYNSYDEIPKIYVSKGGTCNEKHPFITKIDVIEDTGKWTIVKTDTCYSCGKQEKNVYVADTMEYQRDGSKAYFVQKGKNETCTIVCSEDGSCGFNTEKTNQGNQKTTGEQYYYDKDGKLMDISTLKDSKIVKTVGFVYTELPFGGRDWLAPILNENENKHDVFYISDNERRDEIEYKDGTKRIILYANNRCIEEKLYDLKGDVVEEFTVERDKTGKILRGIQKRNGEVESIFEYDENGNLIRSTHTEVDQKNSTDNKINNNTNNDTNNNQDDNRNDNQNNNQGGTIDPNIDHTEETPLGDNSFKRTKYYKNGFKTEEIYENNLWTKTFCYNAEGTLFETVEMEYNAQGGLIKQKNIRPLEGTTWVHEFDGNGNQTSEYYE